MRENYSFLNFKQKNNSGVLTKTKIMMISLKYKKVIKNKQIKIRMHQKEMNKMKLKMTKINLSSL